MNGYTPREINLSDSIYLPSECGLLWQERTTCNSLSDGIYVEGTPGPEVIKLLFESCHAKTSQITDNCCVFITKTYLYNFDPLKPHFYIINLGFTGVYIIFHISAQNIDCGYSLEPPRRGGSNEYPQSVLSRNMKNIRFLSEIFRFFGGEIF